MSIINFVKEVKRTELGEQQFVGVVVANNDPAFLGRIKVRVVELFGTSVQIPDENLPWACKMDGQFLGKGSKEFSVPAVGTQVFVYFSKGDIYSPVYTGEIQAKDNYDPEQAEAYGNLVLKKDRKGNKVKNNLSTNQLDIVYNGKVVASITDKLTISVGADLEITISAKATETVTGDKVSTVGGKSTETVTGDKEITATKVKITAPVEITGNVTIVGTTNITGNTSVIGNVSATGTGIITGALLSGVITTPAAIIGGKPFATHTHSNVASGPSNTGPVA